MVALSLAETGIEQTHYRTISIEDTQGEIIVESISNQFDFDEINWQQKIITMTDGCNTMEGHFSGVKKRLGELVLHLKDLVPVIIITLMLLSMDSNRLTLTFMVSKLIFTMILEEQLARD